MINRIIKIIRNLLNLNYRYLITRSIVISKPQSLLSVADNVKIINSQIFLEQGSSLIIEKGCVIRNVKMYIKGSVYLGKYSIIDNGYLPLVTIKIENGEFYLGNNNRIRSNIWVRFNGKLSIQEYNNINEESEIRCDELIEIGSFNQISYKCMIWDTNTHNIYNDGKRRELTKLYFPTFGYEYERPKTSPVRIGNDCWLGRESSLLKGVIVKNSCVIAYKTTLSNCVVEENHTVISKSNNIISRRVSTE